MFMPKVNKNLSRNVTKYLLGNSLLKSKNTINYPQTLKCTALNNQEHDTGKEKSEDSVNKKTIDNQNKNINTEQNSEASKDSHKSSTPKEDSTDKENNLDNRKHKGSVSSGIKKPTQIEKSHLEKDSINSGKPRNPLDRLRQAVGVSEITAPSKIEVPNKYNKLFVLPIARRPLFPGFYKAVVIKNVQVIAAIKDLLKKGEPFLGAFMLKDDNSDVDFIENTEQVHSTGVFAQITSVFPSTIQEEDSLTIVLYSHRRVILKDLVPGNSIQENLDESAESPEQVTEAQNIQHDNVENEETPESSDKDGLSSESTVSQVLYEHGFMVGEVENIPSSKVAKRSKMVRAVTSEIVSVFKEISAINHLFRDQIASFSMSQSAGNVFEDPARLADFSAAVSSGESKELQEILEELDVETRLEKALIILKKELLNAQLQNKISKDVEAKITKRQREFYLMEQLRGIKRELGLESDGKDKLIEQLKAKVEELKMPNEVKKVFDEEITKLAHLEPSASEFNVTRNYLDWLTQIPWGKSSIENYDIKQTKTVLDHDHYGLEDVKDRILEFVAVGKLRGAVQGKILCFVGPPGVGKTSIGKSIAQALGREFYRFSVGGLSDVAEIKGHRRTYVGAMPGKVVQALKKAGTENPLVLIDEIDKLGKGHQGDPASALLELLDPEQNFSFLDHYMDVPMNLSRVLFVCTANTTDTIPGPLLDRMEVIRLSGYLADEKLAIAKQYLVPQAKLASGLEGSNVNLTDESIESLIRNYCRESGVRNLKKSIEKIFRKAALEIVKSGIAVSADPIPNEPIKTSEKDNDSNPSINLEADGSNVNPEKAFDDIPKDPKFEDGFFNGSEIKKQPTSISNVNTPMKIPDSYVLEIDQGSLKSYIGPPLFTTDRLYQTTVPGVVMGLAWTSLGGSALYVESIVVSQTRSDLKNKDKSSEINPQRNGSFQTTGSMGDVMKESSRLAYTYAQAFMNQIHPENDFFSRSVIHMHVPEGATPKDGPSAGVTMTTSLLSLAFNQNLNSDVAMTGELTLTGKVLKIGGLREKVIAAKRSGVTRVIFPIDNIPDWEDLPEHVKEGVEGCPVSFYSEIPKLVGLSI
ncbi:hypothetical protein BB558_001098 [Smittium angustum]|uniref:Lon protease homolog, mitochondrial n=1 Tax=Smittium angustum TaxID=133377 RepID=A0A2U1JCJ5_SMIAN|nr:hypothetical protein BB558_001098 [Smittium angustum]